MLEWVWKKGNSLALLVGMQIDTATMEDGMEIPLKTGNKTTIWSAFPLLGTYSEETKIEKTNVPQCLLQHYLQ